MKKSVEFGLKGTAVVVLAIAVSGTVAAQKSNRGLSPVPVMRSGSSTTQYYTISQCGTPQMKSLNETAVTTCGSSTAFATNGVRVRGGALEIETITGVQPALMHLGLASADASAVVVVPHGERLHVEFTVAGQGSGVGITEANTQAAWFYQDDGSQELLPGIYTISAGAASITDPSGGIVYAHAKITARYMGSSKIIVLHVPEESVPIGARVAVRPRHWEEPWATVDTAPSFSRSA